MIMKADWELVT